MLCSLTCCTAALLVLTVTAAVANCPKIFILSLIMYGISPYSLHKRGVPHTGTNDHIFRHCFSLVY